MGDRTLIDAVSSLMANIRKNIIGVSVPNAEDRFMIEIIINVADVILGGVWAAIYL
jgi:hypothetical protein